MEQRSGRRDNRKARARVKGDKQQQSGNRDGANEARWQQLGDGDGANEATRKRPGDRDGDNKVRILTKATPQVTQQL